MSTRSPALLIACANADPVPGAPSLLLRSATVVVGDVGDDENPHEARLGRPFAWTAGKTLFRWFERALGATEAEFRSKVYMAAVVRNFPGKSRGGGSRVPSASATS